MSRKILIICPGGVHSKGGIARMIGYLLEAWHDQDDALPYRVIDSRGKGRLIWSPIFLARGLVTALMEILLGRVALMHVNMAESGSTIRKGCFVALAALTRVPVILHLHSGRYHDYFRNLQGWKQAIIRRLFLYPRKVIVLGEIWRSFAAEEIGVEPAKVVILHNAVPAPAKLPPRHGGGPCRLLFLGRLNPDKGIPELMSALADERVRDLNWTCVIAGEAAFPAVPGGRIDEYLRRAQELGLAGRIDMPGWVDSDQVRRLLYESDVTLLPSHYEGLSMCVLEGMSYGHAVITTRVGALGEVIEDEVSGLFVPVGDKDALAETLLRVIGDRELCLRLGKGALQRFQEKFDIAIYAREITALYKDCGLLS